MPLIHSKSKKAFSENVTTEMEHGKPQKQALAIAYSNMRRAGHKMASGGICDVCGGKKCMWGGGLAEKDEKEEPKPTPQPSTHDEDFAKEFSKGMKSVFAKGGEIKGVNKPEAGGISRAGAHIRDVQFAKKDSPLKKSGHSVAKSLHKETLKEMEEMPNPKLKGLAKGGHIPPEKGVHSESWTKEKQGHSDAGELLRQSNTKGLGPNLKKSMRKDIVGEHKNVLRELKEMPNPKLKGLADGGKVSGFDLNDQAVANWMAEGKHTGMDGGGEVESDNEEMLEHCAQELINAFESKNKKEILDSIKAIVLSLKG